MPYSKDLNTYPLEFFSAWDLALKGQLKLRLPTKGKATNLKHRLNAFRRLLAESNLEARKFYDTDLEIAEEPSTGMWIIFAQKLDWKKQITEQANPASSRPESVNNSSETVPINSAEGAAPLAPIPDSPPAHVLPVVVRSDAGSPAETPDHMSAALEHMGFSTKK